jgi:hypothetical protein
MTVHAQPSRVRTNGGIIPNATTKTTEGEERQRDDWRGSVTREYKLVMVLMKTYFLSKTILYKHLNFSLSGFSSIL